MNKRSTRESLHVRLVEPLSLALILEVSGYPKPGNVHRLRDRAGLRYEAFLATGVLSLKYFLRGLRRGLRGIRGVVLGDLVYGLVKDVIVSVRSTNTCLGSALILSNISVALGQLLAKGELDVESIGMESREVIAETKVEDSLYYYKAIRIAKPSYLRPGDQTGEYVNVWDPFYRRRLVEKNHRLIDVLKYSSRFDVVADEVINGLPRGYRAERFLRGRIEEHGDLNRGIVETYLYLLAENRDTIVYLKHGDKVADHLSRRARSLLEEVIQRDRDWLNNIILFDEELYEKNINPGSIADLTAESIGLYLLRNLIENNILLDLSR